MAKKTSLDLSNLAPAELRVLEKLLDQMRGAPVKTGPRRKHRTETIKYLTEAEIARLFAVITRPRDVAIFRVAYHRGLRASEVGEMQMEDYRIREERLFVRRKKGSAHGEFHLTSNEVRALRAWLRIRGTAPGPLFPSNRGRGISNPMLDVLIKKYGALAGIPREKCHMHVLKHSCATHLLARGESIDDVRDHLGHVSYNSTAIYAQFTSGRRQARDRRLRDW